MSTPASGICWTASAGAGALVHKYQAQQLEDPGQQQQTEERQQSLQSSSVFMHGGKHARPGTHSKPGGPESVKADTFSAHNGEGLAFALRGGIMLPDDAQRSESATLASRYGQAVVYTSCSALL